MSDSISREAVLNTLDNMDKALDENRTVEAYKDLLKECFKELPPVEPQEWISVKDRLQIEQDSQGNLIVYCPHCNKAIWKTFKRENEDEDY